jgi:hypothetical protein
MGAGGSRTWAPIENGANARAGDNLGYRGVINLS